MLPLDVRHLNGVIPKHHINYTEISLMVGQTRATKEACKNHCEVIFKKFADKAHAGFRVESAIPQVGQFSISVGICAVIFKDELVGEARDKTAVIHGTRHHSAKPVNNLMNARTLERENTTVKLGTFNRLKGELDKEFENRTGPKSIENLMSELNWNYKVKTAKEQALKKETGKVERPGSCYGAARSVRSLRSYRSRKSSVGRLSQAAGSVAGSAISVLPELDPIILSSMAWEVFQLRSKVVATAQSQQIGLREILTSTKLQKLLQSVGYPIKIQNLKALLKELGFNWNGAACSVTKLVEKLKVYTREPHIEKIEGLIQAEKMHAKPKVEDSRNIP